MAAKSGKSPSTDSKAGQEGITVPERIPRFAKAEEERLLTESTSLRQKGNTFFTSGSLKEAQDTYNAALESCPNYLYYEIAVIQSNIAACHLRAEEWKDAVVSAGKALDNLDKAALIPDAPKIEEIDEDEEDGAVNAEQNGSGEENKGEAEERQYKKEDVDRLRTKALLRRARARLRSGGWMDLTGAQDDYKALQQPHLSSLLPDADRRSVTRELRDLPPKIDVAKQKETAEMMGKLKDLGNGILKPFGLSTENFQFIKDEKSGGYNMQFNNSPSE